MLERHFGKINLKLLFYGSLAVIEFIAAVALAYLTWAVPIDIKTSPFADWPTWIISALQWQQGHSLILLTICASSYLITYIGRRQIRSPRLTKVLKNVLDDAHSLAFPLHQGDPMHDHRITLYQRRNIMYMPLGKRDWEEKKWYQPHNWWGTDNKPWSGWLIPIARSGHTTQKLRTVFLADKNRARSEGVCGQAWEIKKGIKVDSITAVNEKSKQGTISKHCRQSYGIPEMVQKRIEEGFNGRRSIAAIPIIIDDGDVWGVLCLDSISAEGIGDDFSSDFIPVVQGIQRLLEGFR